jgi:hypothetical protein
MRAIEIDFDVHKKIELERTSFEESPNTVLRRLLGLPIDASVARPTGGSWSEKKYGGLTLPAGTPVRMAYNGQSHEGVIDRGLWLVEGTEYRTPSGAALGVARTKDGTPAKLNGWVYWEALLPGSQQWVNIWELAKRNARAAK